MNPTCPWFAGRPHILRCCSHSWNAANASLNKALRNGGKRRRSPRELALIEACRRLRPLEPIKRATKSGSRKRKRRSCAISTAPVSARYRGRRCCRRSGVTIPVSPRTRSRRTFIGCGRSSRRTPPLPPSWSPRQAATSWCPNSKARRFGPSVTAKSAYSGFGRGCYSNEAVIRIWSNLPQDVQNHLFQEAVLSENSIRLGVRVGRQNHRMIGTDAGGPALARNVRHRLFKSRRRLEAENLFLRHQLSICLEACAGCEVPVLIEQRLFALARAIQQS